jgi:transposase
MQAKSKQELREWFDQPGDVNHRRYEILRAVFVDGDTHARAAARFGVSHWTVTNLVRDFKAGRLEMFAPPGRPGPAKGSAPARDRARARAVELRRDGMTAVEISARLAEEGTPLNRNAVGEVLREEGFGRLLRRPGPGPSASPATPGRDTALPRARTLEVRELPPAQESRHAGLLLLLPDLLALDLPGAVEAAGYPGTREIPALNSILSLLALKLTGTRRVSHVDDLLLADPAAALFAGMAHLPKKTALTSYSYSTTHDNQAALLAHLDHSLAAAGATGPGGVFNLDFHSIIHWGHDPVLEKHFVPTRSQRARSVLAFVAEDAATRQLVHATADVTKATQAESPIEFCDHWKDATGADPAMLVMDQRVTTGQVLARLDERGVKFITLRPRNKTAMARVAALAPADYTTVTLDRPGRDRPRYAEDRNARIAGYPDPLRQLTVTGLGHDNPTLIITNDTHTTPRNIINTYAHRMGIEQRLAELIRAFNADALSSTVNLNVDLDLALCVWAQAVVNHLADRLPGYHHKTPDTIQRRFLETPGLITTTPEGITVRLNRRAYTPTLLKAGLPQGTPIPWWNGTPLNYEIA